MSDDERHSNDEPERPGAEPVTPPAGTEANRPGGQGADPVTPPAGTPAGEQRHETPRGRVRQQDASTQPREPTLAEKRAREQKLAADREAVRLKEARSKTTKRVLIGAGATIGVVALIAGIYAASGPDEDDRPVADARCVDGSTNVVVPEENCAGQQAQGQVSDGGGGFAFVPIFLGGGGRQYHYNYGGSGGVGQVATGGTVRTPPAGTTVRSGTSGSTIGSSTGGTISRGGLGVGGSASSGS